MWRLRKEEETKQGSSAGDHATVHLAPINGEFVTVLRSMELGFWNRIDYKN